MASEKLELSVDDLEDIKALVECGMQEDAQAKLLALARNFSSSKEDEVFSQGGTLTRDLHDAIVSFAEDERLKTIANVDMPKASERLSSIIDMTNKAASRTLDAVDACEPMVRELMATIDGLLPAWSALTANCLL